MSAYADMCGKINELQLYFENKGFKLKHINVGGGLGVNYEQPDAHLIPDFESYFRECFGKIKSQARANRTFRIGTFYSSAMWQLDSQRFYTSKKAVPGNMLF